MRILRLCVCLILPLTGLGWVSGCSNPMGGGGGDGGSNSYTIEVSVSPETVTADSGLGMVSCFLRYGSEVVGGQQVWFSSHSENVSNANITVAGFTSSTSETGLSTSVFYRPNDYEGDQDTVFAVYEFGGDTVAIGYDIVQIHHPDIELELFLDPLQVYADTGNAQVYCFLKADDIVVGDKLVSFWAASEAVSNSHVTAFGTTSATSTTGLFTDVLYQPDDYAGAIDTVYACYIDDEDTLAFTSTLVEIIHP
ncbi:hypothetical protein KJ564_11140 [bacterium]|nr:hypothetical protein [bacterium]